eukprot:3575677-Ditylum_brightwellii.AAC.1
MKKNKHLPLLSPLCQTVQLAIGEIDLHCCCFCHHHILVITVLLLLLITVNIVPSSNSDQIGNTATYEISPTALCRNHWDMDTYCVRTEYAAGGYPTFRHIQMTLLSALDCILFCKICTNVLYRIVFCMTQYADSELSLFRKLWACS